MNHQQLYSSEPFGQTGVRQYLFAVSASASLVLMVLAAGMWIRSHYQVDTVAREQDGTSILIRSIYGRILVTWGQYAPGFVLDQEWTYSQTPIPDQLEDFWEDSIFKRVGLEWRREPLNAYWGVRGGWIRIRWPLVVALAGILPLARVVQDRRQRRRQARIRRQQCPRCGCDLRGIAGRCPACGNPPADEA